MNGADLHNMAEEIIDNTPAIALRISPGQRWQTVFISRNIANYGYDREDFLSGKLVWTDIVHPDDKPGLLDSITASQGGNGMFSRCYRIVTADGQEVRVRGDGTAIKDHDGTIIHLDCIITEYGTTPNNPENNDGFYRQQRVLKEILQGLHHSDSAKSLYIILDSSGIFLDVSRVLLYRDEVGHRSCRSIHEWCNEGIDQVGESVLSYQDDIPEIGTALRDDGRLIVLPGKIPPNSNRIFTEQKVLSSAIFSIQVDGDRFGFMWFQECVNQRDWPKDSIRFLQTIAGLLSPAITRRRHEQ